MFLEFDIKNVFDLLFLFGWMNVWIDGDSICFFIFGKSIRWIYIFLELGVYIRR